jgi:hypothetical protein
LSQEIGAVFEIYNRNGVYITVSFAYDVEDRNGILSNNSSQVQAI